MAGDLLLDGRAPSPQDTKQPPDVAPHEGIARHSQALRLGRSAADDVLPARRQFGQTPSAGIDGPFRPEIQRGTHLRKHARIHPVGLGQMSRDPRKFAHMPGLTRLWRKPAFSSASISGRS